MAKRSSQNPICSNSTSNSAPDRRMEQADGSRNCPSSYPRGTGAWKNHVLPRSTRPKNFQYPLEFRMQDAVVRLAGIALRAARAGSCERNTSSTISRSWSDRVWVMPACSLVRTGCRRSRRRSRRCSSDGRLPSRSAITTCDAVTSWLSPPRSSRRASRRSASSAARLPQHGLRRVLRQPLVVGEIEGPDELALHPVVAYSRRAASRRPSARRCRTRAGLCVRRARPFSDAPEMEMLHRPLGQVLALRDRLRGGR